MASAVRVLMFAEAVTLAHVARPLALARALDPARFDTVLACAPRYAHFTAGGPWAQAALDSIPGPQFAAALAKGAPVYDLPTLERYVEQDLALIAAHRPDVIVGDFRLSLSVSARLARVPYLTIANAYWSPYFRGGYALPVLPISRALPLPLARALFAIGRPVAFALHAQPLNQLRRRHGLAPLGHDLRRAYTDADHHLVPDIAALYPLAAPEGHPHTHIGPLTWSPDVPLPAWWLEPVPDAMPTVYVTLGSSGPPALLAGVLSALDGLPVRVLASTAGSAAPERLPANARVAGYLPGDAATARAQLVVCNGGSLTVQQALGSGVPVLGLATNMDQFLNMAPIAAAGAGMTLRTDRIRPAQLREACLRLLAVPASEAARRLQPLHAPQQPIAAAFDRALATLLPAR